MVGEFKGLAEFKVAHSWNFSPVFDPDLATIYYRFNPYLLIELLGEAEASLVSDYGSMYVRFELIPIEMHPIDIDLWVPNKIYYVNQPGSVCFGMKFMNEPVAIKVTLDVSVYSCAFQLLNGLTTGVWYTCTSTNYGNASNASLPPFTIFEFFKVLHIEKAIVPFNCPAYQETIDAIIGPGAGILPSEGH